MRDLRSVISTFAFFAILFAAAAAVDAQATRTWVSGVGDDVNPCSRTAPCKTFAGAISKTATNGVINCLDPAGFGAVTITKSMTIDCTSVAAGVLVSGTNGVIINITNPADTFSTVRLKGLLFTGLTNGNNAVAILSATRVYVEDSVIDSFENGISVDVGTSALALTVSNTKMINYRQNGVKLAPISAGSVNALISNSQIIGGVYGILQTGTSRSIIQDSVITGNANGVSAAESEMTLLRTTVFNNGFGVLSTYSANIRLSGSSIIGNTTGLSATGRGRITSLGNNVIDGNITNGAPSVTIPVQ